MSSTLDQRALVADLPDSVTQSRILTPMLGIFPGSTAAYSALEFMYHARHLSESDRKRVALIYIDTDEQRPELITFRKDHPNMFNEYIIRIAVPANIRYIARIPQDGDATEPHTYIGDKIPEYFTNGAGGIRNNGHVAACHDYQTIIEQLNRALGQITSRDANQGQEQSNTVQVNIAAFIGGGTASGITADLACTMREILSKQGLEQRINLLCILPTDISSSSDIDQRYSNAVACLTEVMALGMAAQGKAHGNYYSKFMRANMQRLSNDPIANEIFLIGKTGLKDPKDIARIIGLDLFQRTLNASSIGALESSTWVNRTSLGDTDDRGLPTMFGTSCPLEVRFPAEETALAFAQVAASHLLPLLASYQPRAPRASQEDQNEWRRKWRMVGRIDAVVNDPMVIAIPEIPRADFEDLDADQIEMLWGRVKRMTQDINGRIEDIIDIKRGEELQRIRVDGENQLTSRVQYWQSLQQEYETALEDLKETGMPAVPLRPTDLENAIINQPGWLPTFFRGDKSVELYQEYGDYLQAYAKAERHRQLQLLLENLLSRMESKLKETFSWATRANVNQGAPRLKAKGQASAAWHGRLDHQHPFQYHIFDLPTLCTQNGNNIAIERLYVWATVGKSDIDEADIEYQQFISECITYIAGTDGAEQLQQLVAKRLTQRVVDFFQKYYRERFRDANLFDLLEYALPPVNTYGKILEEQQEDVLTALLEKLRKQMVDLVTFDARVGGDKCVKALKPQVFLGCNWHDGQQESMLKDICVKLNLPSYGDFLTEISFDPHRLQIAYGKHAISLGTIPDFYYDRNSAMEQYRLYQKEWHNSQGKGPRPPHSSDELERLVTDPHALGYIDPKTGNAVSLIDRLIRLP